MKNGNWESKQSGCLVSQKAKPIVPKWQIELLSRFFFIQIEVVCLHSANWGLIYSSVFSKTLLSWKLSTEGSKL